MDAEAFLDAMTWAVDAATFVLAVILIAGRKRNPAAVVLALILLDNIAYDGLLHAVREIVTDRTLSFRLIVLFNSLAFAFIFGYIVFITQAVDAPITRWFRTPRGRAWLYGLWAASFLVLFFVPGNGSEVGAMRPNGTWAWPREPWVNGTLLVMNSLLMPLSLFVSIGAVRAAARGSVAHKRAWAYLAAFIVFDINLLTNYIAIAGAFMGRADIVVPARVVVDWAGPPLLLVFLALFVRALFKWKLFDYELRVRGGLRDAAIAFVFIAVAVAAFQLYGAAAGFGAALVLSTALAPTRRLAQRALDRFVPDPTGSPEYVLRKKLEVYRGAIEEALAAGGIDEKRGDELALLRAELGLNERDHEILLATIGSRGPAATRATTMAAGETILGKYRIDRRLGAGAGGETFLAEDVRMQRPVVIKRLSTEGEAAAIREARAAAASEHPNVVRVYDIEGPLLVMEYIEGGSLKERLQRGPLKPPELRAIAEDLLLALEAVHARGAIHRDVKPSNVLLTREGRAKLADFGVSRLPGFETTVGAGTGPGTLRYMAPEQARGRPATPKSDLWSAAATLYEAVTGHPYVNAAPGETAGELQMRVATIGPFDRDVEPPTLRTWFARALAPEPSDRFASASEMRAALSRP